MAFDKSEYLLMIKTQQPRNKRDIFQPGKGYLLNSYNKNHTGEISNISH